MHTLIFADGALGAKNARDCSQKQYFDAGMERQNGDRNGQKSEKSKLNDNNCSYWGCLGVKKVNVLIKIAWSRFAKMLSPLEQEQHFWKNVMQKMSWSMKNIKEAVWSLHFWCIFVSRSVVPKFFSAGSALAEPNAKKLYPPRIVLRICIKTASFKLLLLCFSCFNSLFASQFFKNVVPAQAGDTFLQNDFKWF